MTLGAAGASQVLGAADLGCVGDANGSTCTGASARSLGKGLRLDYWNVTTSGNVSACPRSLKGTTGVTNLFSTSQQITLIFTLPVAPIGPATVIGGSFGGAVADANFDGVGGIGTVAMSAIYTALIDGVAVATLDADPFFVPGPAFPGTFAFAGASQTIPATSFGLPGPATPGPPVAASIGIQLDFNLGALDSLAVTSDFIVDCVPTPTSTPHHHPNPYPDPDADRDTPPRRDRTQRRRKRRCPSAAHVWTDRSALPVCSARTACAAPLRVTARRSAVTCHPTSVPAPSSPRPRRCRRPDCSSAWSCSSPSPAWRSGAGRRRAPAGPVETERGDPRRRARACVALRGRTWQFRHECRY